MRLRAQEARPEGMGRSMGVFTEPIPPAGKAPNTRRMGAEALQAADARDFAQEKVADVQTPKESAMKMAILARLGGLVALPEAAGAMSAGAKAKKIEEAGQHVASVQGGLAELLRKRLEAARETE